MVRLWSRCNPVAKLFIYTYVSHHTGIQSQVQNEKLRKSTGQDITLIFKKLCRLKKKTPHPKRYKQKSDPDSPEIDPPETSVCEPEMVT